MAKLGEFIGALLSDAAQARVRADMEALKIAEAYSTHELLKHLPVPRFRLPDITVDFPVLISAVDAAPAGDRPMDAPTDAELTKVVDTVLSESGVLMRGNAPKAVIEAVRARSKEVFAAGPGALLRPARVSGELSATLVKAVREGLGDRAPEEAELRQLEARARSAMTALLVRKLSKSPSLEVVATSSGIKAHGDNDSVMRIRLTISEDAYEVVDRDEGDGFILTPE